LIEAVLELFIACFILRYFITHVRITCDARFDAARRHSKLKLPNNIYQ